MRTLVWLDRQAHEEAIGVPPREYWYPRISLDGTRIALDIRDQDNDVWIWNAAGKTLSRLALDPLLDSDPVRTPDEKRLFFGSNRNKTQRSICWQSADGTGAVERVTKTAGADQLPISISPDFRAANRSACSSRNGRYASDRSVQSNSGAVETSSWSRNGWKS